MANESSLSVPSPDTIGASGLSGETPGRTALPPPLEVEADAPPHAKTGSYTGYLVLAVIVLVMLVAGGRLADLLSPPGELQLTGLQRLALILSLAPVLFAVLAVHEWGHLLGARSAGFRFALFVVGPLLVMRRSGRVRWSLNRNPAMFGGATVSAPVDLRDLRGGFRRMLAGGPAASLLCGAVALGLSPLAGLSSLAAESPLAYGVHVLLTAFGLVSLLIGAVTLAPQRMGGMPSDGAWLLELWRGDTQSDPELALLALSAQSVAGIRPRDWDPELVRRAAGTGGSHNAHPIATLLAYRHALDQGDVAGAGRHLQDALRSRHAAAPLYRPGLSLEAAWYEAVYRRDAAAARAWYARMEATGPVEAYAKPRADAAIHLAERDLAAARRSAERARALLGQSVDTGSALAMTEDLDRLFPAEGPALKP